MRILYVEDDTFDADLTRRALQKTAPHFGLDIARTQKEAIARLEDTAAHYDILLTDLRLPDGSGFDLLAHVRERRLPLAVVIITGQGDEEIAVSVLKAGANDYLVKREDYLDRLWIVLENTYQQYRDEAAQRERPLRVLYLENNLGDIETTCHHFTHHAPHIHLEIVHTVKDFFQHLPKTGARDEYDTLLLDYYGQELNSLDLLKELRQMHRLDLPIVLVTAQGDEELAAQALRLGANDYVVKNPGYLFRLPGLLENAYHRVQMLREQVALRASEERYRRLAENAPDIIYRLAYKDQLTFEYLSPAICTLTGYSPEELYQNADLFYQAIHPGDLPKIRAAFSCKEPQTTPVEFRMIHKDGRTIWLEGRNVTIFDIAGAILAHEGVVRDITERKQAEAQIERQLQRLNALRSIDAAITADYGLQRTLTVLLEHVLIQLGVDAADIFLYETGTQKLEYRAGTGFRTKQAERLRFHLGEGPTGRAALDRQTVQIQKQGEVSLSKELEGLWSEEDFTSYFGAPLIAKEQILGVLEVFLRRPLNPDVDWLAYLETLAGQAAIAIDNAALLDHLQRANQELTQAYDITLEGWVNALDLRDKETEEHTRRVTSLTIDLAKAMGIEEDLLSHVQRGALLHDIGKIAIPDRILHKPGPLTPDEWQIMRRHPEYAFQLLSPIQYLHPAMEIPYCHHEHFDGSGYPRGLKGEAIPLAARVFAVVDVWDALISDRPYRKRWDPEKALEYIRQQSGAYFDPAVVEAFLKLNPLNL
jgi:PAS domain S-box-containing protein